MPQDRRVQDRPRVVAITGASSGIGRATAILFARKGWSVGMIARGADGLAEARRDVVREGARASVATADVANAPILKAAADKIERELGPIDVWVNDAGVGFVAPFTMMTDAEFRRVTDTVYLGTVNGTRVALDRMKSRDRGTIVQVGSAIAYRAVPLMTAYSGAKYAMRGFTEGVRSELIHDRSNVHLTMVHPPAVNTPFFSHAGRRGVDTPAPPPPAYQPEVIADAIFRAATSKQREVFVGSQAVIFATLNKFMPGAIDWAAGKFGYAAQQTKRPEAVRRRDIGVFSSAKREHSVRGPFPALPDAWFHWSNPNRELIGFGAALLTAAYLARRSLKS